MLRLQDGPSYQSFSYRYQRSSSGLYPYKASTSLTQLLPCPDRGSFHVLSVEERVLRWMYSGFVSISWEFWRILVTVQSLGWNCHVVFLGSNEYRDVIMSFLKNSSDDHWLGDLRHFIRKIQCRDRASGWTAKFQAPLTLTTFDHLGQTPAQIWLASPSRVASQDMALYH